MSVENSTTEHIYRGIGVSPGIAIAKVLRYASEDIVIQDMLLQESEVEKEVQHFLSARTEAKQHLEVVYEKARLNLGEEEAEIFEGHIEILMDDEIEALVLQQIMVGLRPSDRAVQEVFEDQAREMEDLDNTYMAERASDIRSIKAILLSAIKGLPPKASLESLDQLVVIIAEDLEPADTATMDRKHVAGFAIENGGVTSHVSIMAKSLEIPAVITVPNILSLVSGGENIIIDGNGGVVVINPTTETLADYQRQKEAFAQEQAALARFVGVKAESLDGKHVECAANIGSPADLNAVLHYGADGIGLFRSEFLFMNASSVPSEEEQYQAYSEVVKRLNGKPVIIRTLDVGGDKAIPYLAIAPEENPFLGYRAIRLCLEEEVLFITQLRAILRASTHGKARILLPMITSIEEVRKAKALVEKAKTSLRESGQAYDENIEIGVMIETPAAAVIADVLIKEVDYFSIGTNDLTQYTMAVDRGNPKVRALYNPFHPAILRLISQVVSASHAAGKWTGMCGEFAGNSQATKLLLALGLDELSMSAPSINAIKKIVLDTDISALSVAKEKLLSLGSVEEVMQFLNTL